MYFKDFGIIVVKPDGCKMGICKECEKILKERGIKIIKKIKKKLTQEEIRKCFFYRFKDYIEYMCENEVCAYFLETINIDLDQEIFVIKNTIRKNHNVDGGTMRNFIHGSHSGTEFFIQRNLFFPEFCKAEYSSFADEQVICKSCTIEEIEEKEILLSNSNVKQHCFCFYYEDIIKNDIIKRYLENKKMLYGIIMEGKNRLIYYVNQEIERIDKNNLNQHSHIIALDKIDNLFLKRDFNDIPNSIEKYIKYYKREKIHFIKNIIDNFQKNGIIINALTTNLASFSLLEAETRFEVSKALNLLQVGGSGDNIDTLSLFGVSFSKHMSLINEKR